MSIVNGHSVIGLGLKQKLLSDGQKASIQARVTKTKAVRNLRVAQAIARKPGPAVMA